MWDSEGSAVVFDSMDDTAMLCSCPKASVLMAVALAQDATCGYAARPLYAPKCIVELRFWYMGRESKVYWEWFLGGGIGTNVGGKGFHLGRSTGGRGAGPGLRNWRGCQSLL